MESQEPKSGWLRWVGHRLRKAKPQLDFWTPSQRVTRATDLPKAARLRIDKVVGKTMLWRKEQTEVAKRLVKEFEDGLSQGVLLEDLLKRYGRPRRAAKAIRREVIAKRSRGWHIRSRIRKTLCYLAIASYIGLGIYYAMGSPKQRVDYLEKLNARAAAVPEEDRAWPVYREVWLELGWEAFIDNHEASEDYKFPGPDIEGWEDVVAFLEAHQEEIATLRAAAEMPGLGFVLKYRYGDADLASVDPEAGPEDQANRIESSGRLLQGILMPHLGTLREIGQLLNLDALAAAQRGDAEACTADLIASMRMARFADEQPLLISGLVRISIRSGANYTLSRVIIEHPDLFSDAQLVALDDEVASSIPFELDLSGERMLFDDYLQQCYTDNGRGGGHFDVHQFPNGNGVFGFGPSFSDGVEKEVCWWESAIWYVGSPITVSLMPSRSGLHELYRNRADRSDVAYRIPMRDMPEIEFDREMEEIYDSSWQRARYLAITLVFTIHDSPRRTVERYRGQAEGTMLGLALERYRLREGAYPETLDALVPEFVAALPVDRMNGEALHYRVSDAGPVIYSVGSDGDDDGGLSTASSNWSDSDVWEATPSSAARWSADDPADGDWILWPLHDPPLMPEPVDGKHLVR